MSCERPDNDALPLTDTAAGRQRSARAPGRVALVGAGPGDAGLITWRGLQYLRQADVILYDYLANEQLLEQARSTAERICLGRHGRSPIWSQPAIEQRMIEEARAGHFVVRLKGGDPGVFGRLADELSALSAAGIPYEVVPGITAALAGPAYAGIPLTERTSASAVAFITAHESPDKTASQLDYQALANFPGTLVWYMGVTEVAQWSQRLLAAGRAPDTPVAAIRHVSRPHQQVWTGRLDGVAAWVQGPPRLRPPVVFVCGGVVALRQSLLWFEHRPLFGRTVLVTRAPHQTAELVEQLAELGAEVLVQSAIEIKPLDDWNRVDEACSRLHEFDWLVFSSANGVRAFLDRLWQQQRDLRQLSHLRLAAIGPGTAGMLEQYHLRPDLVPDTYRAESLAKALRQADPGGRFLLLRASRGREVLAEMLRQAGATVEQVVVYCSQDVTRLDDSVRERLERGDVDWTTVTSSAIARSLVNLCGDRLHKTRLASLSPVTSQTLGQLGLKVHCEATDYTLAGMIQAMLDADTSHRGSRSST